MTKEEAIHQFWNSFGVSAYDENTVPDDAALPYITYEVVVDSIDYECIAALNIWGRGISWRGVTALKDAINNVLSQGGATMAYDGGMLWIKKGRPFAMRIPDDDPDIRHISINIIYEFLSQD